MLIPGTPGTPETNLLEAPPLERPLEESLLAFFRRFPTVFQNIYLPSQSRLLENGMLIIPSDATR
jgi:hypothetical protein